MAAFVQTRLAKRGFLTGINEFPAPGKPGCHHDGPIINLGSVLAHDFPVRGRRPIRRPTRKAGSRFAMMPAMRTALLAPVENKGFSRGSSLSFLGVACNDRPGQPVRRAGGAPAKGPCGGRMISRDSCGVSEGDLFVKAGNPRGRSWKVVAIRVTVDGIPHAQMVSCDNRSSTQTVSTLILRNREFWLPVAPSVAG